MAKPAEKKTNVMRLLDQHKIPYKTHCYAGSSAISAADVAKELGQDPSRMFKTLVTCGKSRRNYVFVVSGDGELDLKKAAKAAGEKSVEMIPQKQLLPLTGYIHGGCSPIGMKKQFPTFIHESALSYDTIIFSAGQIGYQVEVSPKDLAGIVPVVFADIE